MTLKSVNPRLSEVEMAVNVLPERLVLQAFLDESPEYYNLRNRLPTVKKIDLFSASGIGIGFVNPMTVELP